jgi:hypothetical protein
MYHPLYHVHNTFKERANIFGLSCLLPFTLEVVYTTTHLVLRFSRFSLLTFGCGLHKNNYYQNDKER